MLRIKKRYISFAKEHYTAIEQYIQARFIQAEAVTAPRPHLKASMPSFQENKIREKQELPSKSVKSAYGTGVPYAAPLQKDDTQPRKDATAAAEPDFATFAPETAASSLDDYLEQVKDESFSEMLLRLIDEKGMKDTDCYKKANVDKRLFSKIRSNSLYKPGKQTALAFIFALELPYEQACEMLQKAGYAFSPASKADLICEYYIKQGIYNLYIVNQSLFDFDQPLIGNFK